MHYTDFESCSEFSKANMYADAITELAHMTTKDVLRPRLQGGAPKWNRTQKSEERLRAYVGIDGTVPNRTASRPQTDPPTQQVLFGTEPKSLHRNSQNDFLQVCLDYR